MKKPTIELVTVEAATLRADVREILSIATTHARALADIGEGAYDALFEVDHEGDARETLAAATRLRGTVVHALTVLAELQAQAGRLEQVAALRQAAQGQQDED